MKIVLEGSPIVSWLVALLLSGFVGNSDRMIFEFTKDGCGPCSQLQPAIDQLKREGWSVREVNTDREPLLVRKYEIKSLPTLVVLEGGREVERIVGAAPYEKIAARLAKLDSAFDSPITSQPQSTPIAKQSQTANPGPTVRGQSQVLNAFPMLNSVASAAAISAPPVQRPTEQPSRRALENAPKQFDVASRTPDRNQSNPVVNAVANPSAARTSPAIDPQQAISIAQQATVRIRVDEENTTAYGTGTIVDVHGDEALVLTCGHLFREMKPHSQLTIDLYSSPSQSTNLPAQLIDFKADDGQPDIGLLSFRLPFAVKPVALLPKGERLAVGQPAFSFGCDHGQNPTRRDTQVKSINRYLGPANVEIVGAPAVGRSGGGLFDAKGQLIGVCNAAEATGDEGIYAAAEVVYAQIDRLGLTHLFESNERPNQDRQADSSVQLASNQSNVSEPLENESNLDTADKPKSIGIQWPDEKAGAVKGNQLGSTSTPSVTCILRDASGKEQVVNINSPTPELLEKIRQASSNGAPNTLR